MKIRVDYISRVEGEAAVELEISGGRLRALKLNIWEPPRFFEGFLRGRRFDEVPDIVARICGICPISHMTTAIRAIEKALGLTPPAATVALRRLMAVSQIAASHVVHLYMLALPDYHRLGSIAAMLPDFKPLLDRLIRMKEVFNRINAVFGGRALHPVAMVVAGFTKMPVRDELGPLIDQLAAIRGDVVETVQMIAGLEVPELASSAEFVAIRQQDGYAVNEGRLVSSRGLDVGEDSYLDYFTEEQVGYANAKRTVLNGRGSLMVGALARLNLKFDTLHPEARAAAAAVGFAPPQLNPFLNNLAQAIELVHLVHEAIALLDNLPDGRPWVEIRPRAGAGAAVTEAPRGLLYHSYEIDRLGGIAAANIVTPTAHNFLGLEENLRALVQRYIDEPPAEITRKCEMLVRAYDPCFSCSVH